MVRVLEEDIRNPMTDRKKREETPEGNSNFNLSSDCLYGLITNVVEEKGVNMYPSCCHL